MVNTQLFQSQRGAMLPAALDTNNELAPAYAFSPRHQLAQLAATGCLRQTFYAQAQDQLDRVMTLAAEVDPAFVARTAVYARESGHMKDMPALLAAILAVRDLELLAQVFPRVIDSGKMLRNFVQILRSGAVGRKSLGTRPKKLVQRWLLEATEKQLLNAAVGNAPSLADVVKMVHPKPAEAWRAAWFAWLIGKPHDEAALPPATQALERFKRDATGEPPDVPFQMLTALGMTPAQWAQVARAGSWQMVRQNLNTFARHGVFEQPGMAKAIAAKLRDPQAVAGRGCCLPADVGLQGGGRGGAGGGAGRAAGRDGTGDRQRAQPARAGGRVSRRVGVHAFLGHGLGRFGDVDRALRRRGRPGGRRRATQESPGACAAVRLRRGRPAHESA